MQNEGRFKSLNEIFSELEKPAGRFRVPLSLMDRILVRGGGVLANILQKFFGELYIKETGNSIPAQWRALLGYLYKEKFIQTPRVSFAEFTEKEPCVPRVYLAPSPVAGKTDGGNVNTGFSAGSSLNLEEALSRATGELLERYPLLLYREKELLWTSIRDLGKREATFLDPRLISAFTEEQKERLPDLRFTNTDVFGWVNGFSATRSQSILIPAQLVYWNYRKKNEPKLRQPNTNGMAGFFTLEEAVLSGLYELLHRDGFLLHWLTKTPPAQIDLDSIENPEVQALIRECRGKNLGLFIFDVTTDIPAPAVVCTAMDRNGGPAISMGGGGGPDPIAAIKQAISETVAVYHWLTGRKDSFELPNAYEPFFTAVNQNQRALLWKNSSMLPHFEFFLKGEKKKFADCFPFFSQVPALPRDRLRFYVEALAKKGEAYEVAWFEAVHPILKALRYHSVHVVVPGLLPLYLTETYAPLAAPRLARFRETLPAERNRELSPMPQPFT